MSLIETLLDPVRRAKAAEHQVKLAEVMGHRVARRPGQANYLYGVARVAAALELLATEDPVPGSERCTQLLDQLAEGLALQSQFELAISLAPDGPRKDQYQLKAIAVSHVGEQQCQCPVTRTTEAGPEESTQLTAEKTWNGKVTIVFTRCLICNALSAYA
jgi:hypothetical protein